MSIKKISLFLLIFCSYLADNVNIFIQITDCHSRKIGSRKKETDWMACQVCWQFWSKGDFWKARNWLKYSWNGLIEWKFNGRKCWNLLEIVFVVMLPRFTAFNQSNFDWNTVFGVIFFYLNAIWVIFFDILTWIMTFLKSQSAQKMFKIDF